MSEILLPVGGRKVAAAFHVTPRARGSIVFVHGSGVDRHDERNVQLAECLRGAGFDTVLLDLLEPDQALDYRNAFDVELQVERLDAALEHLRRDYALHGPYGYFATGIGAGVALLSAAKRPQGVAALVARAGRPDTVLFWLPQVQAPTLLIVEEPDDANRRALDYLRVEKQLVVVPSESHFFREPEARAGVQKHALRWFSRHMPALSAAGAGRSAAPG